MSFEEKPGRSMASVVDAILEVGRQRTALLEKMRSALESGDDTSALFHARELCGLHHEESHSVN